MRGSGTWDSNERPESWREMILRLWPNGMAPLTAMTAKLKNEEVQDPVFHWFEKGLWDKGCTLQDSYIYEDAAMATAVSASTNAAVGTVVYAKVTTAFAKQVRVGHVVMLRLTTDHRQDLRAIVESVNTTTGAIGCRMLETDAATDYLATNNRLVIIGSAHAEGAARPSAISYTTNHYYNYTQIFRTSMELTRTAMKTKLRTGNSYQEIKRDCLLDHSMEMEWAWLFGTRYLETDDVTGQPRRFTYGIVPYLRDNYATNVVDFKVDYVGNSWVDAGKEALDTYMELASRYKAKGDNNEKLVFCGNGALLGIQQVVEANASYNISRGEVGYGIKVRTLESVFGTWHFITHPLFNQETSMQNAMLLFNPKHLTYRYVTDTMFKEDRSWREGGNSGYDGPQEEYLTEAGLEIHHPETFMYIKNVGIDG
jgi:hypothetical protein